ncbi:MAG: hypothetical protein D6732_17845 [Methanobacteriota archaeon]|nr:MAG: hypothetical protein D6732_17845 [Euryarchaeota archaeon]
MTLAGYILEQTESKIPKEGQIITDGNLFFKIVKMDNNRIEKVEVRDHLIRPKQKSVGGKKSTTSKEISYLNENEKDSAKRKTEQVPPSETEIK